MVLLRNSLRGRSSFHITFNSLVSRCPMKIIIKERTIYLNESGFRNFSTWAVWYFLRFGWKKEFIKFEEDIYSWNNDVTGGYQQKIIFSYTRFSNCMRMSYSTIHYNISARYLQSVENDTKQRKKKTHVQMYCKNNMFVETYFVAYILFYLCLVRRKTVPSLMKTSYFLTMTCYIPLPVTPPSCITDIRYINWSASWGFPPLKKPHHQTWKITVIFHVCLR